MDHGPWTVWGTVASGFIPRGLFHRLSSIVHRLCFIVHRPSSPVAVIPAALVLALLFGALPTAARGQESGVRVLSLAEALRIAADQNKDIQTAKEYRKKVFGIYIQQRSAALPQVTVSTTSAKTSDESQKAFGGGYFTNFPVAETLNYVDTGVTQAIFTWGQVGAAIRAAKEGMADADDQLLIYQQAVARDVSTTFYNVLLAKALNALARQNIDQKTRHWEEAKNKYDLGTATDYDVLAAKVAVENARPEVIRTENLILTSREQLRFLLGLEGQPVDASGTLEAPVGAYPRYEDAITIAQKNRPELWEMDHRQGIARELLKIDSAADKPRLDFKGNVGYHHMSVGDGHEGGLAYTAGIFLTFPVFDAWRTAGKVIQDRSDLESLRIERAKLADSIALQVRQGVDAVKEAGQIVEALSGTVAEAEKLQFMAEKGFEFGVKTHLDVEDAQQNLNLAKFNLSRARHDYLVARLTLDWTTGTIQTTP